MKRCPKCDFIYEDDQSLCDMDGALLVFDSRTLPNLRAVSTLPVPLAAKPYLRNRILPALATLVLGIVLFLVYYVSTQRTVSLPPSVPLSAIEVPVSTPPATAPASESIIDTPTPALAAPEKTTTTKAPAKKSTVKPETTPSRTTPEKKKDESKVGSIIKKTGRILKKPFKF